MTKPTGVITNGIGERTTAHLNLTVPLKLQTYPSISIPPRWNK